MSGPDGTISSACPGSGPRPRRAGPCRARGRGRDRRAAARSPWRLVERHARAEFGARLPCAVAIPRRRIEPAAQRRHLAVKRRRAELRAHPAHSVLVTTQMKVSSGKVWSFHSGVSRNSTRASSARSCGLHLRYRQRARACQRGIVGELLGQPRCRFRRCACRWRPAGHVKPPRRRIALVRLLLTAAMRCLSSLLPFARPGPAARAPGAELRDPLAPRAAICASEAAASEPCAHCAVWNISRTRFLRSTRPCVARRCAILDEAAKLRRAARSASPLAEPCRDAGRAALSAALIRRAAPPVVGGPRPIALARGKPGQVVER